MRANLTTFRDRFATHPDRRRSEELIALFAGIAAAGAAATNSDAYPSRDSKRQLHEDRDHWPLRKVIAEPVEDEIEEAAASTNESGDTAETGTDTQAALTPEEDTSQSSFSKALGDSATTTSSESDKSSTTTASETATDSKTESDMVSIWGVNVPRSTAQSAAWTPVTQATTQQVVAETQTTGETADSTGGSSDIDEIGNIFADDSLSGVAIEGGANTLDDSSDDSLENTALALGETVSVSGGMVTTLEIDTTRDIAAVEVLGDPDVGNVTVNPDNTLAVVLSGTDYSGSLSFDIQVTYGNGSTETETVTLDVAEPEQEAGWGFDEQYMLETDENGELIVEAGENHRKVYLTGSDDGLTAADIAEIEGLNKSDITGEWLVEHPEYGATEDMALADDIGMELWYELSFYSETSNWLLFEKGYTYEDTGGSTNYRLITRGLSGEDALHPVYISSWGEGDQPVISENIRIYQEESQYIVFDDVAFANGITALSGSNIILNDISSVGTLNIQDGENYTIRNSEIYNVVADAPDSDTWSGFVQGLYASNVDGLLLDGDIFWHNGWEDGYDPNGSTDYGMPSNGYSHNIYLQNNTTDVTFTNNISAQGSSFGAQLRGGAYVEGNLLLDNNIGLGLFGGVYGDDGAIGNFSFVSDNVITSGAQKKNYTYFVGAYTAGLWDKSFGSTYLDNIIAHMADPNNEEEIGEKTITNNPANIENSDSLTYDNTIIYNWGTADDSNIENLDEDTANATTIQNYAAALLGNENATITDLMEYLISLINTDLDDSITAESIVAWFQEGFGIEADGDQSATSHTFIPNALASGMRWTNSINWDSETVPEDGDNVDLNGNWVHYGATTTVADLDLGEGGELYVNYGRLTVDDTLSVGSEGGLIRTVSAGQFWTDGYSDKDLLTIEVDGGRFANTGNVTGSTLLIATDGETILATDGGSYHVTAGSELRVGGSEAMIGFDGDDESGLAFLSFEDSSILSFIADAAGVSAIEEFHSGKWEDSAVTSGVSLNGSLEIDLSEYTGGEAEMTLIAVDQLIGSLDDYNITGLDSAYDAKLIVNYRTDTVTLSITDGAGNVSLVTRSESTETAGIITEVGAYEVSDMVLS